MPQKAKLSQARQRAIAYLNSHDCFTSQSSPNPQNWQPRYQYKTTFIPALILGCLTDIDETKELQSSLSQFLLKQKSATWSFNYWSRQSPEYNRIPYPEDLDDTACSLIALHSYNPVLVSPRALAGFVKTLVATEATVGGPYKTWLSSRAGWQDIDCVVNANIAYAVALVSNRLPNLDRYINQAIISGECRSPYYSSDFAGWYFLARVCTQESQPHLASTIQAGCQKLPPSGLHTALALQSLCQLSAYPNLAEDLAQHLLQQQQADGSWPAAAFCLDPKRNGKQYHAGSSPLTTALALQALTSFKGYSDQLSRAIGRRAATAKTDSVHNLIVSQARASFSSLQPDLRQACQQALSSLLAADSKHQITLLPTWFSDSLASKPPTLPFLAKLGLANLYGWMAYTIYDDFIDEEGQPKLVSVANVCLRQSLMTFQRALPSNADFQTTVLRTFDTIDGANSWEVAHCRSTKQLPNYGSLRKLAERSWGHSLTPLAILLATGHKADEPDVQAILTAFRHYLIARQLDDDAHDWKADLARGHMSYTVTDLLRCSGLHANDTTGLQRYFWQTYLSKHCHNVSQQIELGRLAIHKNPLLAANNIITSLFDKIQTSIDQTRRQHHDANEFLNSY